MKNNKKFSSIIKIDLTKCETVSDVTQVKINSGIPLDRFDPSMILEYKKTIDVLFVDSVLFGVFACINKGESEIRFCKDFKDFLIDTPSVSTVEMISFDMDIDLILDKISSSGIESLSKIEKRFLKRQSKV